MNNWILCKDRQPKKSGLYIVTVHKNNDYRARKSIFDFYTDEDWSSYGGNVMAWMPLPEPLPAETIETVNAQSTLDEEQAMSKITDDQAVTAVKAIKEYCKQRRIRNGVCLDCALWDWCELECTLSLPEEWRGME